MSARAFYNDIDPIACAVLRELMSEHMIPEGDVNDRSITDISANELVGYTQIHLFAGAGGWPLALRLAGWPDDKPVLTGSCPCQPFSCAGKQKGCEDERHLWPEMLRLISELLPAICLGEQVASKAGRDWLTRVRLDLEGLGYAVGAADLCAAGQGEEVSVLLAGQDGLREACVLAGPPHIRQRLFWGAVHMEKPHVLLTEQFAGQGSRSPGENGAGARREFTGSGSALRVDDTDTESGREEPAKQSGQRDGSQSASLLSCGVDKPMRERCERQSVYVCTGQSLEHVLEAARSSLWSNFDIVICRDRNKDGIPKARRIPAQSGLQRVIDGIPCVVAPDSAQGNSEAQCRKEVSTYPLAEAEAWKGSRVGLLRLIGNAIDPRLAAEFVRCLNDSIALLWSDAMDEGA